MITIAIDASSKSTGIAVFKDKELIYKNCIVSNKKDTYARIKYMVAEIEKVYKKYGADNIIIEDVIPEDVRHNQSVYKVLIYLQAAIVLMFHEYQKEVEFYTSSEWRAKCGIHTGRGIKRESLKAADINFVKEKYNMLVNDDVADAICIGWAYINAKSAPTAFNWE